ncbi:MAG: HEAT repeat domain-containing protein [Deltaproteobacteria bacterium]|nr:HEAT repeat domain-containing protein [Deltaproteobacteria bacterium]
MRKSVASPEPVGRGLDTATASATGVGTFVGSEGWVDGAEQAARATPRKSGSEDIASFIARDVIGLAAAGSISGDARRTLPWPDRGRWALAGLLLVVGCGRTDPTPAPGPEATSPPTVEAGDVRIAIPAGPLRLAELAVADLTPEDARAPGFDTLAEQAIVGAFIDPARTFARAPEGDPGGCRAAIRIGYALLVNGRPVAEADAGSARAVIEAELFCPAPDPGAGADIEQFRLTLEESRPFGGTAGGTGRARLEEVVRQVARDTADGLFGQATTRHQDDARILTNLGEPIDGAATHDGILSESASEAGERRLTAAVPDLVRLTAHPNTRVAVRAGAALGLLKVATPEVLQALVKMTEGPNPQRHLVAIHALADLGTPEARRYLDSLATGHPIAVIRELARERLRTPDPTAPSP